MSRRLFDEIAAKALCQGRDEEIYPANGRPRATVKKELCPTCPVRQQCLEWALNSPYEPYGMWAGFDQDEVRVMWYRKHPGWAELERVS